MWSIARRLKTSFTHWPRWKLLLLLVVGLCVLSQLLFLRGLWMESLFRQRVAEKGQFNLGPSRLPAWLETPLRRWIGPQRTNLLCPIVELVLVDAKESDWISVANHGHLKSLEIVRSSPDAASISRLRSLRQLTTVSFRDCSLDAKSLSGLAGCDQITRLQLVGFVKPEALESLKYCESIRELYLGNADQFYTKESPFTDLHLAAVAKTPHLNHLVIAAGEISDIELRGLAYARELKTLTIFDIRVKSDAMNILGRLPRLQELVLEPINEHYSCEPRPLKGFLALKAFSITNSRISSAFAVSLAKLPKLEALSLNRCWVNEGLPGLAGVLKLKMMDLAMTDINSEGFQKIGPLKSLLSLSVPNYEEFDGLKDQCPQLKTSQTFNRNEYFSQPQWPRRYPTYGGAGGMGGGGFF